MAINPRGSVRRMGHVEFPRDVAGELLERMTTTGTWGSMEEQKRLDAATAAQIQGNAELTRPLPSRDHLEAILDVVYVASLMEEEGRRIDFTLAYLGGDGARHLNHKVFPFKRPLPFDPKPLAKYALSTEPLTTSLAVWPSKGGDLRVWGLTHHGDHTFDVDLNFLPTYLSVRVLRTGTFAVHFDARLAMLFSRNHHHLFPKDSAKRIDLVDVLRDWVGLEVPVAVALQRVCRRMVALGHGGTILLTEKGVTPNALTMHDTLTMREGSLTLLKDVVAEDHKRGNGEGAAKESKREGTRVHEAYRLDEKHREALDFVAHLSAVDGAVVLDDELNVHGYGATISTEGDAPAGTAEDPKNLGTTDVMDLGRRGNRHRSAAYFCARQTGLALAFVASQDGDFSLFIRKKDGGVHVLGPYELGVGL